MSALSGWPFVGVVGISVRGGITQSMHVGGAVVQVPVGPKSPVPPMQVVMSTTAQDGPWSLADPPEEASLMLPCWVTWQLASPVVTSLTPRRLIVWTEPGGPLTSAC
jgi:hypothetical protein